MVNLTNAEKALLLAFVQANNFSPNAHYPEGYIIRFLPRELRNNSPLMKEIRTKTFKSLKSKGLIIKHPTGRETTWGITREGILLARQLLDQKK